MTGPPSIQVRAFILGSYPIRGFLAWAEGDDRALFVDPGGWDDAILQTLDAFGLAVAAVALTHGHSDHTEGLLAFRERLGAPVYAHAADAHRLPAPPDVALQGGEEIACGTLRWRVLPVPGHTPGSVAYVAGAVVFTGDTLFAGSIGGTATLDDYERERHAIRTHLFPLGDDTRVYPAHGPATLIGVERRGNPFLR
ncbi:MAG TPA: MBL fold metallo-hydrolase [Armatimonadota bacterium]|nr:MBL fold metallo-hydrolase [Armatimonadota bacterium]